MMDSEADELITMSPTSSEGRESRSEPARAYPRPRREEIRQAMLDKLRKLDGSNTPSVSPVADITAENIERLGDDA